MFDQASNVSQCQWLKGFRNFRNLFTILVGQTWSNGQILHFHTISLLILTHQPSSPIARFPHREGDGRSARIHLLLRSLQWQKPVPCGKPSGRWGMVGLLWSIILLCFIMFYYRMIYVFFTVWLWENTEILLQFHSKPSPMVVEGVKPYMGWCKMTQLMAHEPVGPPYAAMKSWLSVMLSVTCATGPMGSNKPMGSNG